MSIRTNCPKCSSENFKKNSHIHNGKQNHQCKDCGREFVLNPEKEIISQETKELAEKRCITLLLVKVTAEGHSIGTSSVSRMLIDKIGSM